MKHRILSLALFIAATLLALPAPAGAEATTYVQDSDLQIGATTLKIAAGSQYDSIVVGSSSFTVTVGAGQAFSVRYPGTASRSLENDALQPACNVTPAKDNQLIYNGPGTITITPSTIGCSNDNSSSNTTPTIAFVNLNVGETVKSGTQVQIFWTTTGTSVNDVRLSLSVDGGKTYPTVLVDRKINDGIFNWTVPTIPTTSRVRLRIDGYSQGRIVAIDLSDTDFTIHGTESVQLITTPPVAPAFDPQAVTMAADSIDANQEFPQAMAVGGLRCNPGSRIKGTTTSGVYYCGWDGKRHAFANQRIHDSWYGTFAGVITLSDSMLASISLGANITYRPGVRMLKIQTDPKVYVVGQGGLLRWVQTEADARAMYGDDWNKNIDDVSDALFVDYKIGNPIASAQ